MARFVGMDARREQRPLACQFGKDSTRMAQDVPPYEMSIF
jgi:hypothetical protein